MRKPKFEIYVGKDHKIEFRLKAANGEPVLFGPGYRNKSEAVRAVSTVMHYGLQEARFVKKEKQDGKFYFQLKSPMGRLLGWSEYYESRDGMIHGIQAVCRAAKFGQVKDLVEA